MVNEGFFHGAAEILEWRIVPLLGVNGQRLRREGSGLI